MNIDIKEWENLKSDVFLMDGEKIVEYKISLDSHLVRDFIINITLRYVLSKETKVRIGKETIILDEYMR